MRKLFYSIAVILLTVSAVSSFAQPRQPEKVRNVIFMIGDGMGLSQVSSAMIEGNYALMAFDRAQFVGLAKTYSADNRVTDSAAAGTALATGTKTYNGAIGVDTDKKPLVSIREKASAAGYATGVVVTCYLPHATPAAFVGHQPDRNMLDEIAAEYLTSNIDVMIGGGMKYFSGRADGRDLVAELKAKGYTVATAEEEMYAAPAKGKLAGILAPEHMPSMLNGRGDYLPKAVVKALDVLSKQSPKGFFLMVEGSQIDFECHANNAEGSLAETIDFDKAVRAAMDFADKNPGTLVVVTADHETGGLALPKGKGAQGVEDTFSTGGHTGTLVPVYAYGTGAAAFSGVYENTELPKKMQLLLGLPR